MKAHDHLINEKFCGQLDGVLTTIDFDKSLSFINSKCLALKKCMLNSTIKGAKCCTQTVIPYESESCADTINSLKPQKFIKIGAVEKRPTNIDHLVIWAKDMFESEFVKVNFKNEHKYDTLHQGRVYY